MPNKQFVIVDPQFDHFISKPIKTKLSNYHAKYAYFLNSNDWEALGIRLSFVNTSPVHRREIKSWISENKISRASRFYRLSEFTDASGICFALSAKHLVKLYTSNYSAFNLLSELSKCNTFCILINHFMTISPYFIDVFGQIKNLLFVCERSPLSYSKFLKKEEVDLLRLARTVELPYIPRRSLANTTVEDERIDKCAIIGTSHPLDPSHPHVIRTGVRSFSEIRETLRLLHSKSKLDYTVFAYYGSVHSYKAMASINSISLLKILSKIRLIRGVLFRAAAFIDSFLNKSYYNSFSMESVLSSYSLALCGEEDVLSLPVIGFFEALMSGCIPLGSLHGYYQSIGLYPNVHYIPYDGTYEDARSSVEEVLGDKGKIRNIQKNIAAYSASYFLPRTNLYLLSREVFS